MSRWQRLIAACLLGVAGCATRQTVPPSPPDPFFGTPGPGATADATNVPARPAPPPVETPASTAALATASGVSLGAPRTVTPKPTTSNTQPITPTAATEEKTSPPTYEQLQARLRSRGVAWQQLQCLGDDRWHFICAIPNPANANDRENYETTRAGNMGLNAMIAVLEQIDRDRTAAGGSESRK
jgi:hypothetical protein